MAAFVARRALRVLQVTSNLNFAPTARLLVDNAIQVQKRQISFSRVLATRLYSEKHEWLVAEGNVGTVGISDHAQDQLGEIVYVETPEVGTQLEADDVAGCLESVKAASDVFSPVGGKVIEVNETLGSNPSLVNAHPLTEGWLYKLEMDEGCDTSSLMDETAYLKFVEQSEH